MRYLVAIALVLAAVNVAEGSGTPRRLPRAVETSMPATTVQAPVVTEPTTTVVGQPEPAEGEVAITDVIEVVALPLDKSAQPWPKSLRELFARIFNANSDITKCPQMEYWRSTYNEAP
jgi:hypothetical protein